MLKRGAWAVVDQAFYAAANFVLSIILGRMLPPSDYGVFATAVAVLWLASGIHNAILIEPSLVFLSSRYSTKRRSYLTRIAVLHSAAIAVIALVALATGVLANENKATYMWMLLALPSLITHIFLRRLLYIWSLQAVSARSSGLYFLTIVTGALVMIRIHELSVPASFGLMGLGGFIGSIGALIGFPLIRPSSELVPWGEILRHLSKYSTWSLPASLASWVPWNGAYAVLGLLGLPDLSGIYRALSNLQVPLSQAAAAVSTSLIPHFARVSDRAVAVNQGLRVACSATGASLIYAGMVAAFGPRLLSAIYGQEYGQFAHMLWPIGVTSAAATAFSVLAAVLRSRERPRAVAAAYACSVVTFVLATFLLLQLLPSLLAVVLSTMAAFFGMTVWAIASSIRLRRNAHAS